MQELFCGTQLLRAFEVPHIRFQRRFFGKTVLEIIWKKSNLLNVEKECLMR